MKRQLTWANIVSLIRLFIIFMIVIFVYSSWDYGRILSAFLVILVIILDSVDGYLARKLNEVTVFGGMFDIVVDHVLQAVVWIILVDIEMIPAWIPIVVISRDIIVDGIRGYYLQIGESAIKTNKIMMKTKIGRFLTGAPIMTSSYAISKALAMSLLLVISSDEIILKNIFNLDSHLDIAYLVGLWLAVLSTLLCLIRGLPVIVEGLKRIKEAEGILQDRQVNSSK